MSKHVNVKIIKKASNHSNTWIVEYARVKYVIVKFTQIKSRLCTVFTKNTPVNILCKGKHTFIEIEHFISQFLKYVSMGEVLKAFACNYWEILRWFKQKYNTKRHWKIIIRDHGAYYLLLYL